MFIGITISDADLNAAVEGAKVGDALEISATVTEINGKRIMADATSVEIKEADEAEKDDDADKEMEDEGTAGHMPDKGMEGRKGAPPKAIIMFGLRK